MKLFTFLLFTLVIGVVVDAQRGNFGANRNEVSFIKYF